jgi:hypothetical protein
MNINEAANFTMKTGQVAKEGDTPIHLLRAAKEKRKEEKPVVVPAKPAMMQPPPRLTNAPAAKLIPADIVSDQEMQAQAAAVESGKTPFPVKQEDFPKRDKEYYKKLNVAEDDVRRSGPAPDAITRASEIPKVAPADNLNIPIQKMNPVGLTPEPVKPSAKPAPTVNEVKDVHKKLEEVSQFFKSEPEGNVIADILDSVGVGLSAYGGVNRQTMRQKTREAELGTKQRQKEIEMQTAAQGSLQKSQSELELANFKAKLPAELQSKLEYLRQSAPYEYQKMLYELRNKTGGVAAGALDTVLGK